MEDLIVVAYNNPNGAMESLRALGRLNYDWLVDIRDAVAVVRDAEGNLNLQGSYRMTPEQGAGWGVVWGSILGGLALAPFTAGASAAVAAGTMAVGAFGGAALGGLTGATGAWTFKEDFGLSEEFVTTVSTTVKPGNSALFALVESGYPEQIAQYFRGTGGTIIQTTLTAQQQEHLQEILSGKQ